MIELSDWLDIVVYHFALSFLSSYKMASFGKYEDRHFTNLHCDDAVYFTDRLKIVPIVIDKSLYR